MANPGKNKTLNYVRMYVAGYNISGDARTFEGCDNNYAEVDMTGWNQQLRNFLPDKWRIVGVRGFQAFMNDTASSGSHDLFKTPGASEQVVSMLFGGNAEPSIGDPAYVLRGIQIEGTVSIQGGVASINANFLPKNSYGEGNPFGVILSPETSLSATTNQTSVDGLAASTTGYTCNLHVVASSGGTWVLKVEHSTDNSSWSTLFTFAANGSAITSETQSASSGTINRYLRFVATRTSGTLTPVCVFTRH